MSRLDPGWSCFWWYLTRAWIWADDMRIVALPRHSWFQLSGHLHWAIHTWAAVYHPLIAIRIRALPSGRHLFLYTGEIFALCYETQSLVVYSSLLPKGKGVSRLHCKAYNSTVYWSHSSNFLHPPPFRPYPGCMFLNIFVLGAWWRTGKQMIFVLGMKGSCLDSIATLFRDDSYNYQ